MKCIRTLALAGASLFALADPALASGTDTGARVGNAPADTEQASQDPKDDAPIIVTARRRDEALLDVPATVNAVSGQELQEFNLLKFEDISALVPGLNLDSGSNGFSSTASTRGVTFDVSSQGSPTVEMYINEVPVEPNLMFQGNFDIGQIEVLRGPQGTLRGRSSPSGAMTQTTRRASLTEFGGSASISATERGGYNLQAAFGVPIIDDMLSLRVAGLYDRNDIEGVKSATNPNAPDPLAETKAGRATLRFEPNSNLSAVVMFQHLERDQRSYGGIVFGSGTAGTVGTSGDPAAGSLGTSTSPQSGGRPRAVGLPGFNGPVLTPEDRMSIIEFPTVVGQKFNILTGQFEWRFAGQKLSYVGGWSEARLENASDGDGSNSIIGEIGPGQIIHANQSRYTHEIRLGSEERVGGLFDYTVGFYRGLYKGTTDVYRPDTVLLPGAFGSPLGLAATGGPGLLSPTTYDSRYALDLHTFTPTRQLEQSIFANLMFHLGEDTELAMGGRQIFFSNAKQVDSETIGGLVAVRNPNGLGPCPSTPISGSTGSGGTVTGVPVGSTYAGTCDLLTGPGNGNSTLLASVPYAKKSFQPFVYSFSLSHHFTPDVMIYGTYGTSWRSGPGPITGAPLCAASSTATAPNRGLCDDYLFLRPETSRAFELGFKAALFDRKLNISIAAYRQKYDDLIVSAPGATPYLSGNCATPLTAACRISNGSFTYNGDAKVKGIDLSVNFRLNDNLNFGGALAWSKGRFDNAAIPCRDSNFDGVPDSNPLVTTAAAWLAAGGPLGPTLCTGNSTTTSSTPWNFNLRGEYSHDVFAGGRAFLRGLFNYYPRNTNRQVSNASFVPDAYTLLNLFVGIRSTKGDWEISVSGRNILNDKTILNQGLNDGTLITPPQYSGVSPFGATSGYRSISFVQRRQFSLNLRWAFGSR